MSRSDIPHSQRNVTQRERDVFSSRAGLRQKEEFCIYSGKCIHTMSPILKYSELMVP